MAPVTICSDFRTQENKVCHCFPICLPWSDGTRCHDFLFFECWILSQPFHSPLLLSSRGSLVPLCFLQVVSSAYLKLLIFLPVNLIPACASSSPVFHIMYSAYKLNKQGDNTKPWHTTFPILNQSVVPCPVLTVASLLVYKFLKRQVRWSGIRMAWRIFQSLLGSTQSKALAKSINRSKCFSSTLLLFQWSNGWQFDLWFLCLFKI